MTTTAPFLINESLYAAAKARLALAQAEHPSEWELWKAIVRSWEAREDTDPRPCMERTHLDGPCGEDCELQSALSKPRCKCHLEAGDSECPVHDCPNCGGEHTCERCAKDGLKWWEQPAPAEPERGAPKIGERIKDVETGDDTGIVERRTPNGRFVVRFSDGDLGVYRAESEGQTWIRVTAQLASAPAAPESAAPESANPPCDHPATSRGGGVGDDGTVAQERCGSCGEVLAAPDAGEVTMENLRRVQEWEFTVASGVWCYKDAAIKASQADIIANVDRATKPLLQKIARLETQIRAVESAVESHGAYTALSLGEAVGMISNEEKGRGEAIARRMQEIAGLERATAELRERVAELEASWRCFHCGEVFTDKEKAAEHFGVDYGPEEFPAIPACKIDVVEYRRMEREFLEEQDRANGLVGEIETVSAELAKAKEATERWKAQYERAYDEADRRQEKARAELETVRAELANQQALYDQAVHHKNEWTKKAFAAKAENTELRAELERRTGRLLEIIAWKHQAAGRLLSLLEETSAALATDTEKAKT